MKNLSLGCMTLAVSFALASALQAENEKKGPAPATAAINPAAAAKPAAVAKVELKNKSAFEVDPNARDPFWPIGWKPAPRLADPGVDHGNSEIPVTAFVVSSITIERGTKFAIVNGKIMQEGQQFGLQLGSQTYQVILKSIEDGRVIISRHGQEVAVPLRRK